MSAFPLMLDGAQLRALVVGGGRVATRKARALAESGAHVRVVAPAISPEMRALAGPRIELLEREYAAEDVGDAMLVVAATDAREVNARVAADARALGRLVNVADAPDDGNCTTAAVHRAGEIVVAVTAGGVPAMAASVRDLVAARIDARYAAAADALAALRARILRERGSDAWRAALDDLLAGDFATTVESGALARRAAEWR